MSPFSDLPSLPGCGRCECGAPEVPLYGGEEYDCYASGNYDCLIKQRRQTAPRIPEPYPDWARRAWWAHRRRDDVLYVRRAYWRALAKATFRVEVES